MRTAKQVVERNMAAYNDKDLERFLDNQDPDVEFVLPGGITIRGREQVRQHTQTQWAAFPDASVTCVDQIATQDEAATEIALTGTNTGPLNTSAGSIAPTGKRVSLRFVSLHRVVEGRVASERVFMDQLELMTQLGLAPTPPSSNE